MWCDIRDLTVRSRVIDQVRSGLALMNCAFRDPLSISRRLLEVFRRETGSTVQLACPFSSSNCDATVEVLLRSDLARAEFLAIEIHDRSSAIGVVCWRCLSALLPEVDRSKTRKTSEETY